ncbi:MAG: penicillin acylase family protein [Alphaproteobacteria bacterium]|nr:penicillin acylase family protein [Alphaproteobacteria bacterium]
MRILGWILAGLFGLALVAVAGVVTMFWLAMPNHAGEVKLDGPSAPIAITRDKRGIPYIRAANEADAAFALGYVHAQDRFAQMEIMRRLVAGRLSEVVGAATIESDRFMRTLGLGRLAEEGVKNLSADAQALLGAYAKGVNAWIGNQRVMPAELLLNGTPEPWQPANTLMWARLMALQLTWNWRDELARFRLAQVLSPDQLRDLFDREADGPHVPLAALDPDLAKNLLAAIPPEAEPRSASNIWALAGSRTETGKPLLANDPHLALTLPNLWYLARIEMPDRVVVGATAPGVPFTILGHNGRVAWGMTTTQADAADLFVLQVTSDGRYLSVDGPRDFIKREEVIMVKGGEPVRLTLRESLHGPVISDSLKRVAAEGQAVALASAALQADDRTADGILRMLRARSIEEARAALADFQAPMQNVGVADTAGHIGLFVSGRVPARDSDGWMPAQATDPARAWKGWRAADPDFTVLDPPSGRIINANNTPVADPLARGYGNDFDPSYRARRIAEKLDTPRKATARDMAALQSDVVSTMVKDVLPILLKLTPRTEANARALDRLAAWDGEMRRDRGEPLIFTAWWRHLLHAIFADEFGESWGEVLPRPGVVARALTERTSWCDVQRTPAIETCPEKLAQSLDEALKDLALRYGPNPDKWRWGTAHRARLAHPLLSRIPGVGLLFKVEPETDGDNWTVNRAQSRLLDNFDPYGDVHGAGYRAVYDLADLDRSLFQMSLGQSGHRLSPHFSDLARAWADGTPFVIGKEPEGPTMTLTLRP